jgi:hypothetical protein
MQLSLAVKMPKSFPNDRNKILAASWKVDELDLEYYQPKLGPRAAGSAVKRQHSPFQGRILRREVEKIR